MLIIILIIALTALGFQMLYTGNKTENDNLEIGGCILAVVGSIVLIGALIGLPISRYSERQRMKEFEAMREAYGTVNVKFSTDRSFIVMKVVECNNWLRESQELRRGLWVNWYYPEEILTIKPIEL